MSRNAKTAPPKSPAGKAEKHEKILDAAAKVFARKGFHNAKVSEIAREAQVADGTIYLYFKNKDDILIHLFEEKMSEILAAQRAELAKGTDCIDRLRRYIGFHFGLVESHPDMAQVITLELRQSHKFMKQYVPHRFFEYLDAASEVIREGQEKGEIRRDVDPRIIRLALFGALDELSLQWLLTRKSRFSMDECRVQVTELILSGLRAGAEQKSERLSG